MEKAIVTFESNGKKIIVSVTDEGSEGIKLSADFGPNGVNKEEAGLHIGLFTVFMEAMTGINN